MLFSLKPVILAKTFEHFAPKADLAAVPEAFQVTGDFFLAGFLHQFFG